ncbi:uncharacterized protein ACLA_046040 [Aspergillus clavatus NRRL 1]|uniref:Uncharacterized protein n=1 Tax=Aspergillus clavatus (strain ATCC 1007 / CBS 513.65 / DSM 816 / NCTC 3887 / NRRL 1 / QM 1276 / 107) TaxID=344612 RepID=A1CGY4_ASPCL|nr:uncharacterized protein ACLA_046040 [Aspergillus clavatus NRRL 1]EAW10139.1 hypothetical protein ACLA_046040 [Aspergillus clavatus NRRL 1]
MAVFPFNLKCSAIILMIASFLAAVAFAVGHDTFYQSLNGKPVLNTQPLTLLKSTLNLSDQQVNISLGTLFAFLVKSYLGVSVSTTFDQFAWKSIQGARTRIGIIDDLLSVLKNGFTVVNPHLWRRSPISMTLAVICWLLPVASIISPATLSVHLVSFNEYALKRIPRVDFTSANFANFASIITTGPTGQNVWLSMYRSPTPETQRVVNSVATQGAILPIEPPAVNSSWSVELYGPAIVCDKVNQALTTQITQNVIQAINGSQRLEPGKGARFTRYEYLSRAPDSDNPIDSAPFYQQNGSGPFIQRSNQLGPQPRNPENGSAVFSTQTKPLVDGSPLSLFVAIFPHAVDYHEYDEALENMDKAVRNSTILQCMLHNASYQANLTYVNGEQTVQVTNQKVLNGIVYITGVSNVEKGLSPSDPSFVGNAQVMESLSYQSIMDAFGGLVFGSISTEIGSLIIEKTGAHKSASYTQKPTTNIISTTLMETEEMRFIQAITSSEPDNSFFNYWHEKSVSSSNDSSPPLSKALEELFRNITFSFMSSNMFQPNYTVKAVPDTNVTITPYRSIYIYTRSILWAAYGTALSITALSVIAGILVYFSNDGSYSSKFSTIFRVTQGAVVSTNLSMKDYSGLDPLPDHIANAKMTIGYDPDYPARALSMAALGQLHRESTASSQLLETPSDEDFHNDSNQRRSNTV